MKINKVVIRNFKKFKEETFNLSDHIVIAGPNNSGKTTLLQAIASWSLALDRWRELNDYQRHGGAYTKAPIARQAFYTVPLLTFNWLWHRRDYRGNIEIAITFTGQVVSGKTGAYSGIRESLSHPPEPATVRETVTLEIRSDSSEQVYVRPKADVDPQLLRRLSFPKPVFVPAMTGLSTEEPIYQWPKINQMLGRGKPGDVLRNLLLESSYDQDVWKRLTDSVHRIFGCKLLPPNTDGPNIVVEYQDQVNGVKFEMSSGGSGFLQVLMLLTFLHSQQKAVLLLDEPDAHLHVILQDSIYTELKSVTRKSDSQLIIATHSEVVINSVDPRKLCVLLDRPRKIADNAERASLIRSLSILSNVDIMQAIDKPMILYVEGHTDLDILLAWAKILNHPLMPFLERPLWKPMVSETRIQGKGIKAQEHFKSLLLVHADMRGALIIDRDGRKGRPKQNMVLDEKLLKLCWVRYGIENYLIHPALLTRFIGKHVGPDAPLADLDAMQKEMRKHLPGIVVDKPMHDESILISIKARKNILPNILGAAGLPNFDYTRYTQIAELMRPDEIHPDISEKLDAIAKHFNL